MRRAAGLPLCRSHPALGRKIAVDTRRDPTNGQRLARQQKVAGPTCDRVAVNVGPHWRPGQGKQHRCVGRENASRAGELYRGDCVAPAQQGGRLCQSQTIHRPTLREPLRNKSRAAQILYGRPRRDPFYQQMAGHDLSWQVAPPIGSFEASNARKSSAKTG